MLKIGHKYYNPKEIRSMYLTHRGYPTLVFTNGDEEETNKYYDEYSFKKLVKEWEKCLK